MAFTNKKIAFFVFLVFIASVFAGTYNVIDSYLTVEAAPENTETQTNEETSAAIEEITTEETIATPVQEEQVTEEPETVVKKYGKENHGVETTTEEDDPPRPSKPRGPFVEDAQQGDDFPPA
jgi:hypothetical protein